MESEIHRDSLGAWRGLRDVGGLELDGRDEDLVAQLKERIDPGAADLDSALAHTSVDQFIQALFEIVQPFVQMFRDVLTFFERAGARQGQSQWKIRIGEEHADLRHFEEFIEHWNSIKCEFDVPALDRDNAFLFNNVRLEGSDYGYLTDGDARDGRIVTGISDVDAWLDEYSKGRYAPFPRSLYPDQHPPGIDDAARVVMAALSVIQKSGMTRDQMQSEHRARKYKSVDRDAFHPWTIAQSETDFWLRSHVMYLANILRKPEEERRAFGAKLVTVYSKFPRRRLSAKVDIRDLERLLSLPAWKKRHEFYGVWVATQIVGSLEDHQVVINHDNGELKFAFAEARIADIKTSVPRLSLYAERRTPLADPVGESRTSAVQPDFGIWTQNALFPKCVLVIEVKHYKKRSRHNFRAALIDYARAHRDANVVLVNYGPVGKNFTDLPASVRDRCKLIGYFNSQDRAAQSDFRDLVRTCVGAPAVRTANDEASTESEIVAIDTSGSMSAIITSDEFWNFIGSIKADGAEFALIDKVIRGFERREYLKRWFDSNELGEATSLSAPVAKLLERYDTVVVVTDQDGLDSLRILDKANVILGAEFHRDGRLVRVPRPG